jgi:hypothetical protein
MVREAQDSLYPTLSRFEVAKPTGWERGQMKQEQLRALARGFGSSKAREGKVEEGLTEKMRD